MDKDVERMRAEHIVKVFPYGQGQAVELPPRFTFEAGEEVFVNRVGEKIILMPVKKLPDACRESLALFTDDYLADGIPGRVSPVE